MYTVRETGDIYANTTKPKFIDKMDTAHVDWMRNVLDGKKEAEL